MQSQCLNVYFIRQILCMRATWNWNQGGFLTRAGWKGRTSPCASALITQHKPPPDSFTYETKLKSPGAGHHSHGPCCLCASWEYLLVYNISEEWGSPERCRPGNMFYSSSLSLVWFFCLMFLQKTGMCVCLVAILVRLSTFPPLTRPSSLYPSLSLSLSALILPCLCVWVRACVWVDVSSPERWKAWDHMLCSSRPQQTAL